jgi:6-pyruvoyltetrahydropterin/6-carboxytetrahydropterin synthase
MATIGMRKTFDAAHRLAGHQGKCRNLHGHTYIVELQVVGEEADGGMVLDFYLLSQAIQAVLVRWDHAVVLEKSDSLLTLLRNWGESVCIVEMENEPTVEHMVVQLGAELRQGLQSYPIKLSLLRVFETPNCWAELTF